MGKQTEALLEQIADVMVETNQECSAMALAEFGLEIDGAKEVVISGLNVTNTASTKVANCDDNVDVDVGRINDPIEERLDQVVRWQSLWKGTRFHSRPLSKIASKLQRTPDALPLL